MRDTILWDLDGTLLDTLGDLAAATNYTLRHFSLPERTVEEVRQFVGNGAAMLLQRAMADCPGAPAVETALEVFRPYYEAHCQELTRPYDGIPELLERLRRRGFAMAIVTNKPDGAAKRLAERYFPGLPAYGDLPGQRRKPDPALCLRALEALGSWTERAYYVGDSEVDVQTALNLQVPCLSAAWGFRTRQELLASGAGSLFDSPALLGAWLETQ